MFDHDQIYYNGGGGESKLGTLPTFGGIYYLKIIKIRYIYLKSFLENL